MLVGMPLLIMEMVSGVIWRLARRIGRGRRGGEVGRVSGLLGGMTRLVRERWSAETLVLVGKLPCHRVAPPRCSSASLLDPCADPRFTLYQTPAAAT
jgi:hypothetical protein